MCFDWHTYSLSFKDIVHSFIHSLLSQVRSYIRVRDGVAHEVSAHDRGTSSGWTQHKRDDQAPKRTAEEREALRIKFARHRLPRS